MSFNIFFKFVSPILGLPQLSGLGMDSEEFLVRA